ncbi:MAG: polysaccharide biosynthesis protein [Ignavibacteria bacterium]|nr:polysaccharide biosynthesis protein [Ignavibacteria bacterium]
MSLTDKVIKNTLYYFISQITAVVFPLLLTPFIINKIGQTEFGIYALVLGFTGSFGLLDLSLSSSYIKFISEYYNKKKYKELNSTVNTGFLFYFFFSLIICLIGYFFTDLLLTLINIPPELYNASRNSFYIALIIFFVNNLFIVYSSVLISIQKMYITSLMNTIVNFLNFAVVIILLILGFRVEGLLISQLIAAIVNSVVIFIATRKSVPEINLKFNYFSSKSLKEMSLFGLQMQISKLATFASEKFDEILLGIYSTLNSVTFFNLGGRILRFAKFLPTQLIVQTAPIASEFNAKEESDKIRTLFGDTSKYLTVISVPIYFFSFVFSDIIIKAWLGNGFEMASLIIKILAVSQLYNLIFSAPGNSITPNIGIPKFQMHEGIMHLILNVIISYILIRNYGVLGAAYGNMIATIFSSTYIFTVSSRLFGFKKFFLLTKVFMIPFFSGLIMILIIYFLYNYFLADLFISSKRISLIFSLMLSVILFSVFYGISIHYTNYLNERDKIILAKIFNKLFFILKKK